MDDGTSFDTERSGGDSTIDVLLLKHINADQPL